MIRTGGGWFHLYRLGGLGVKSPQQIDDSTPMSKYSSSSDWNHSSSGPSLHRTRNFEYIPSTGTAESEADRALLATTSLAESEVVDAIPSEKKSHGLFKVAVAVAAGATSMGSVRKAVGQSVRQVSELGGAVRQGLNGVPEVDPWRCLIATLAVWAVAVVIARTSIA